MKQLSILALVGISGCLFADQMNMQSQGGYYQNNQKYGAGQKVYGQPAGSCPMQQVVQPQRIARPVGETPAQRRERIKQERITRPQQKFIPELPLPKFGSETIPAKRKGLYRDAGLEVASGQIQDETVAVQPVNDGNVPYAEDVIYQNPEQYKQATTVQAAKVTKKYNTTAPVSPKVITNQEYCEDPSALPYCPTPAQQQQILKKNGNGKINGNGIKKNVNGSKATY